MKEQQRHAPFILGKLNNSWLSAKTQWQAMYSHANALDFSPSRTTTTEILGLKTNVSQACIDVVQYAIELVGGRSFYQKNELERLFRDVQASQFHPLPKWDQYAFTAETLLNDSKLKN